MHQGTALVLQLQLLCWLALLPMLLAEPAAVDSDQLQLGPQQTAGAPARPLSVPEAGARAAAATPAAAAAQPAIFGLGAGIDAEADAAARARAAKSQPAASGGAGFGVPRAVRDAAQRVHLQQQLQEYAETQQASGELEPATATLSQYSGYGYYGDYGGSSDAGEHHHEHDHGPPCAVCCPGTAITVEDTEIITILDVGKPVTVSASCPQEPTDEQDPEYSVHCKKASTPSYLYAAHCKVRCLVATDYVLINPVSQTTETGCSADGVQTECTYVASRIETDSGGNMEFFGPCNITATAFCCKQVCRPEYPHPHHHPQHHHQPAPYSHPSYGQGGGSGDYSGYNGDGSSVVGWGRHHRRRHR